MPEIFCVHSVVVATTVLTQHCGRCQGTVPWSQCDLSCAPLFALQVYSNNPALHMEEADLFVYNVLAAANRQQRPLGILFVESFATCGNLSALCDAHCPDERQGRMHYNFAGKSVLRRGRLCSLHSVQTALRAVVPARTLFRVNMNFM